MIRRSSLIALEIFAGLMAALIIALGVAWWRLSQGPVELNFIREQVISELSAARSGRPVDIDKVELAWSERGNALELRAIGIRLEDGRGVVLSAAREARIQLGVMPLLIGRISLRSAEFVGGELSVTHKADGSMQLAFGPPGTPPDIILPPAPLNETLEQRVNRVLDGLEQTFRPVGGAGRLQAIGVQEAKLSIRDEAGGGAWTANNASIELNRAGRRLNFAAHARLEGANGLAPASLRIATDTSFQSAVVEFGAENVRPRALFSEAALGPFSALDAPLSASISIGLDRQAGVTRMEGDATFGRGAADMNGGRFALDGGAIHGRYDIDSDELIIDQVRLAGDQTRINGEMRVQNVSAILRAAPDQPAPFAISFPSLAFNVPSTFTDPVAIQNLQISGAVVASERSVRFERINARVGQATIEGTGRFYWAEAGEDQRVRPGIELDARINGALGVRDVMQLWPVGAGEGARAYLARALTAGRVSNAAAKLDIRPADIANGVLRDEAVDVSFDVADAQVRFLATMSPVTNLRGSAVLRGNRFDMIFPQARINGLTLTNGRVELPQLKPKGALLTISARAEGEARAALQVLAQEPLRLDRRLPIDVNTVTGRVAATVRLQRPMLSNVPFEQWRFNIDGAVEDLAGAMTTRRVSVSHGDLTVRGDQRMINVAGPIRAGGSAINVSWSEYLNRRGAASSEYEIGGDFDARDLVRLGYTIARYAEGRVNVTISGQGRGFDVENGALTVDLRNAAVAAPWRFWTKNAGEPATVRLNMARQADGALLLSDIDARGSGLIAQGSTRVNNEGDLLDVNFSRLYTEGRSDAQLVASRARDGGLDVRVTGAAFDGAPFMEDMDLDAQGPSVGVTPAASVSYAAEPPVRANIQVARLAMRGDAVLQNARVQAVTQRGALALLTAEGTSPGGRAFSLGLGIRQGDPSGGLRLRSDDAGFAVRALTGSENIVGGRISADGDWRPGPPSASRFTIAMRDFQVVRMPAMTRLLTSAGSLRGLVDTLNGDGIGMSSLDATVVYASDRISFQDARMTGPSLGLTASGSYDLERDNLDVDGVLAPSPTLNLSMLGQVPLIGDLLVSRRGEGVFGMTYSINGAVAEPRVGVNPVSALTPGILRRIFEPLQRSQPAPETPAPAEQNTVTAQSGGASAP
ncbi:MAG: DUF3971 domain-containing protein [Hyphomonadaceae bacterium]|nr:DUF3971 domain-containing protein [Hyphomonadaceae bacterium]